MAASHPTWALGFGDEVWWSRVTPPAVQTWQGSDQATRLIERERSRTDPDPAALACYGVLVRSLSMNDAMLLRFVTGRPVSAVTTTFLAWCSDHLAAQGNTALLLIWDNAGWHISHQVRAWIRSHNRQVKQGAPGVRIILGLLPSKSPWLNAIEAKWVHGKRAVMDPDRVLTAHELAERVCAYYGCAHEPHLVQPQKAA